MGRSKVAYRRRKPQNRMSMMLVSLVVLILAGVVAVKSAQLQQKKEIYEARQKELEAQIADEELRAEEIEEYRKYTQTKKYVEEVAKDKLGLVYEDEIVFKEE
ncbi:MAG: septum formation initiator family protein [Lachnospiraceae bacterium]|nr:septum formation initiator family protein [Lachnospiraceae bacterium]